MPGVRTRRKFTEKQKQAAALIRERKQKSIKAEDEHEQKTSIESELNLFLIAYDARLLEINHKYPLGDPDRPEWIETHRKNGVKRINEIFHCKSNHF